MQERNICSQTSTKITAVEENQGKWLLLTLKRFWIDKLLAKRTANSTAGIHSNWIVCRIRCWTYTFFHISSGTFIIRSYVNEHYDAHCENLGDLLANLFGCSSPVGRGAFSCKMSLLLFAEAGVTPVGGLFACTLTRLEFNYFLAKAT